MSNKSENSIEIESMRRGLSFRVAYADDSELAQRIAKEQAARAELDRWNAALAARQAELDQARVDIAALSLDADLDQVIAAQQREAALSYVVERFSRPSVNLQGAWNAASSALTILKTQIARNATAVIELLDDDIRLDASPNFRKQKAQELQERLDQVTGEGSVEAIRVPRVTEPQPAMGPALEMSLRSGPPGQV